MTWTIRSDSSSQGGKLNQPSVSDVETIFEAIKSAGGSLTIDSSGDDGAEKSFQILADTGQYLVTLGQDTDDDYEVRSFNGPKENLQMIEIGGHLYRSDTVCTDDQLVLKIVREFLETGDVSKTLLS
jgi:hypothetical protein